ncbi:MAG: dephospho-CoA kinase [Clostridia bacterium]|nr:dephospho-CoA kinase [Clostridia bacterium]
MQNNIKIAVTGGIGSGKSTVCQIIKNLGYPVISCDKIYKTILQDTEFLQKLAAKFGNVIIKDGKLDKTKLSSIVFSDEGKLKKLNEITHPEIMKELFAQATKFEICFCEVPLLFEGEYEKNFDGVIVVLRSLEERISSVTQRDNLSTEAVKNRIKSQINYDILNLAQYYVIHNDENLSDLRDKIYEVVKDITNKNELY